MSDDDATSKAMLDRLNARLPRMLELQKRVDGGAPLEDTDLEFLKDMLEDANRGQHFVAQHPQLHSLAGQMVSLYAQIVQKAVENEGRRT